MQRRTFLIGMGGGAGLLVLGACSDDDDQAGDSTFPGGDDPEGLDPAPRPTIRLAGDDSGFPSPFAYSRGGGYIQMTLIYDTLLWKDATGEYLPWLAESFEESDDGRSYTSTLRPDIRWHDGEALTAEDVVFTFDYHAAQDLSPQIIVQPLPTIAEVLLSTSGPWSSAWRVPPPSSWTRWPTPYRSSRSTSGPRSRMLLWPPTLPCSLAPARTV